MRRAEAGIQVDKFYPPTDWLDNNNKQIDIRKNAENNSIVLLVGHSADFSKYSLLGLLVDTSSGTYDVYIDDVLVGNGITKNTQYDIDFSTINTTYGSATTPESLVLHKVVIKPTTSGQTIKSYTTRRTTGISTHQTQGLLWIHCAIKNNISLARILSQYGIYSNPNIHCVSSSGGVVSGLGMTSFVYSYSPSKLQNVSRVKFNDTSTYAQVETYMNNPELKRIVFEDLKDTNEYYPNPSDNKNLEQMCANKSKTSNIKVVGSVYKNNYKLKMINDIDFTKVTNMTDFMVNMQNLYPTKLDVSSATGLTIIRTYGSSTYPMRGLRGLKVSNEAPFTGGSPQIDVKYTGLDRDALVELFQSLPTVTGGQTLNCVACSGNNLTKVGSPTIDENGVASGFSSANYLQIAQNSFGKRAEIVIKFTTSNSFSTTMGLFSHGGDYIYIKTNRRIETQFNYGGSNRWVAGQTTLQDNTTYYLKLVTEYNKGVEIWLSTDGINYVLENSSNYWWGTLSVQYARYGYLGTLSAFNGSIDLNETLIKTDRNYLMKGYITDTDKAIALNKGWSLTLS